MDRRGQTQGVIDRLLDGLLPTARQPAPRMDTAADRGVVLARGVAAAIDLAICLVFVELPLQYVYSLVFPASFEAVGAAILPLSLLVLLPIFSTYSFVLEWLYGRTPGKVNRGLLVVTADGRECTRRASAVRNLLLYVDLLGLPPLVVGFVVALVADGRRVGDLVAGTRVVRATAPSDDREAMVASETGPSPP